MAKTVFILGAGASVDAGAPVMANFFDVARELLDGGTFKTEPEVEKAFKNVFAARQALQVVHSKAELDLNNIESVYTALEMAKTIRKFPFEFGNFVEDGGDISLEDRIENLIANLKTLIVKTLEERVKFQWGTDHLSRDLLTIQGSNGSYPTFARCVRDTGSCAILTFNYDLGLDVSLAGNKLRPVYHISKDDTHQGGEGKTVSVLKLHGSLNWIQTEDGIKSIDLFDYANRIGKRRLSVNSDSLVEKLDLSEVAKHNKVQEWEGEPVIVPPSWSKSEYQTALTSVWQRAAFELGEAQIIHIIGYSLPDTDVFFKLLFGLGAASSEPLQEINVYNPDTSVEERFRLMLGPGTEQRYSFKEMYFSDAITDIFGKPLQRSQIPPSMSFGGKW